MSAEIVRFERPTAKSIRRHSVVGTDNQVLKLEPAAKAIKYYVEPSKALRNVPPGFYVRVATRGTKTFGIRLNIRDPETNLITAKTDRSLGAFPAVSLAAACDSARVALDEADRGLHHGHARREARAAAKAAPTIQSALDDYAAAMTRRGKKSAPREASAIKTLLGPEYMGTSIALLDARDVVPKLQQLVRDDKITSANRNPVYLRAVRRYLAEVGIETRDWLVGYQEPKPARKRSHQAPRILEVRAIIVAAQEKALPTWANLIAMTILTGSRIGEMCALRFSDMTVDDENRPMIVIPAARMKGGVEHPIPLTPQMLAVLDAQRAGHQADGYTSDYVFTSTKGVRPIYQMVTEVKNMAMSPELSMHDFRRSLRSNVAGRFDEDLCEVLLAHARPGITGVYNKSARLTDRLEALTWWNDQVMPPEGRL